jgi:carbon-monoxide dehydrogenase iron sulfur subunit
MTQKILALTKPSLKGNLYIDPDLCTGCKTCEIACIIEHSRNKTLHGALTQDDPPYPLIRVVATPEGYPSPQTCRHCEEPWCKSACQSNAIIYTSPEEPVTYNYTQCIGCKSCMLACPFGVIEIHPYQAVPMKCDLCPDRRASGVIPACAEACPTGAITFLTSDQASSKKRKNNALNLSDALLRLATPPTKQQKPGSQ